MKILSVIILSATLLLFPSGCRSTDSNNAPDQLQSGVSERKDGTMNQNIVGRSTDTLFPYQGWPTVAKDAQGTLYVGCSGHRLGHVCPFGENYLYISHDQGQSWIGPIVANSSIQDDRDAGICAWGDGNVLLSWFNNSLATYEQRAADGKNQNAEMLNPLSQAALELWRSLPASEVRPGSYIRLSRDGGASWSDPIRIPLTSPHGPTRTPDGKLLLIGKGFHSSLYEHGTMYAVESTDDGMTWTKLSRLPCPKGFSWSDVHEAHGLCLTDGTILAAYRVHDDTLPNRLTVYLTHSTDGGQTWSEPERLPNLLGAPPHLLQHSSDAVILTYSRRTGRCGQYARISYDSGLTWSDDIAISPEAPDWDHGYPSTAELDDGSLLTVYYQKYPGDTYTSILSSNWTLPER